MIIKIKKKTMRKINKTKNYKTKIMKISKYLKKKKIKNSSKRMVKSSFKIRNSSRSSLKYKKHDF
jgi:hypothetical protein